MTNPPLPQGSTLPQAPDTADALHRHLHHTPAPRSRRSRIVLVDEDGNPLHIDVPHRGPRERAAEDDWLDHVGSAHPEVWDTTLPAPHHGTPCGRCRELTEAVDTARAHDEDAAAKREQAHRTAIADTLKWLEGADQ